MKMLNLLIEKIILNHTLHLTSFTPRSIVVSKFKHYEKERYTFLISVIFFLMLIG